MKDIMHRDYVKSLIINMSNDIIKDGIDSIKLFSNQMN